MYKNCFIWYPQTLPSSCPRPSDALPCGARSLCSRLCHELAARLPTATRSTDLDGSFRLFGQANQTLTHSDNDLLSHVTDKNAASFLFTTLTKKKRMTPCWGFLNDDLSGVWQLLLWMKLCLDYIMSPQAQTVGKLLCIYWALVSFCQVVDRTSFMFPVHSVRWGVRVLAVCHMSSSQYVEIWCTV